MAETYKCYRCGYEFNEDEIEYRREYRGECWGQPAYEEVEVCPNCGSMEIELEESDEEGVVEEDERGKRIERG